MLVASALCVPARARAAITCATVTPNGPCGMRVEEAWSRYTTGDPETLVAYIEGGINWHIPEARELVDSIYVNWHALPVPCEGATMIVGGRSEPCHAVHSSSFADYDVNHDGVVNVEDWANDPRVHDANGNGYLDPEDLIAAFSDGVDLAHSGYPNDISGWDFYDNQNDPATVDATYEHADDQMLVIHHECPKCMIMPIKAGAEALDRTADLAKAWLFAADQGASVIVSVTADLGYSSFMRRAIDYVESKGVAMVESSNDFDSTDHQGGMFWPDVLPGNGAVLTAEQELLQKPGATPPTGEHEYWTRSDYTSWGTHNVLTAATHGGTTSESTPTLGGVTALLLSWGRKAASSGLISAPLSGPEAEQVLIRTARRVTDPILSWPGAPGEWNPQYGYGIPDVYRAMQAVGAGEIPPVARIESPSWYTLVDPTKSSSVPVRGTILAPRSSSFHWVLEAGLGGNPQTWFPVGTGSAHDGFSGLLGTLSTSQIPASFWRAAFSLSRGKELETTEQYAVTFRLSVTDGSGRVGVDRRAINVVHDPSWLGGFPLRLSASGESQPALVDLQGRGTLDAVFATSDGYVHAIDPVTRAELPGWPVHTDPVRVPVAHERVDPGHEPIIADIAVGDLHHDGNLSVAATTENGRVFVWSARGTLERGWPQTCDTGVTAPPIPRPAMPYTRLPVQGATSPPVLYDLQGTGALDVIQTGWDGYLHVWGPDGSSLPGWPVKVRLPEGFTPKAGYVFVDDQKLDSPPAIAYLEGPGKPPDIVVRPQYTETFGSGIQPFPYSFAFAYNSSGTPISGWPVTLPGAVEYYGSAQEFITEGSFAPVAADVTGTGDHPDDVVVAPAFSPPYLISGAGRVVGVYVSGALSSLSPFLDIPVSFTSSGAFGTLGGAMSFSVGETGALSILLSLEVQNSGGSINNFVSSFPAAGGAAAPGFPASGQGIDFLGEPIVAPLAANGGDSVIEGGDANAIEAYEPLGKTPSGFPKWTTGWSMFAPAAGDALSNGKLDLLSATREGYLFAWGTEGAASANTQWWRDQHDEWNSGNYEALTRPPGALRGARWAEGASTATFTAPGARWYAGTPAYYEITAEPGAIRMKEAATAPAGSIQTVQVPANSTSLVIRAVGQTGLLGAAATLR
jgi:hypothetical protein